MVAIDTGVLLLDVVGDTADVGGEHSAPRPGGREHTVARLGRVLGRMLGAASGLPLPHPDADHRRSPGKSCDR